MKEEVMIWAKEETLSREEDQGNSDCTPQRDGGAGLSYSGALPEENG